MRRRPLLLLALSGAAVTFVAPSAPRPPPALLGAVPLLLADPVHAQDVTGAAVAYGHYLGLLLATGCLVAERLLVKPNMAVEEEKLLQRADLTYGLAGILVLVTGYLRVTDYGKGWDFYQHEPIFWLKLTLAAVMGASSFFVTGIILKRASSKSSEPLSEKLAARMTTVINAQLLAIASIPFTATLMARGVAYLEWLPWQAGAAPVALSLGALGYKYIKEAVEWTE